MRKLDFPTLIEEGIAQLQQEEKRQTTARLRLRVQFLRLLKTQEVASIKAAAKVVGVSPKRGYEWWNLYKKQKLPQFLKLNYKPRRTRLSDEQLGQLIKRAGEDNGFGSQAQVRNYLADEFQVSYTQAGVCLLFQRLKIKAKVPRPANIGADKEQQTEYKKTLRGE